MNEPENVFLFDMDGTVAALEDALHKALKKIAAPNEPEIELKWDDNEPWIEERLRLIKSVPDFWYRLEPIQPNLKVVWLAESLGYTIEGLTKGPRRTPLAWAEKLRWVQKHVGVKTDLTITFKKGRYYGRVLFDDYPNYMESWLKHRPRGLGIMPVAKINEKFTHPQVLKYDGSEASYQEVRRRLKAHFVKQPEGVLEPY